MKKISYLLLSVMLMLSAICLCACSKDDGEETGKETTASKNDDKENATTPSSDKEKETEADSKVTYKVTVVDDAGNAIEKAMVQLCKESCVPGVTDANGVAEFKLEEADYKVSLMAMPEGYAHVGEVEEFYFEEGKTELTITLKAQ